MAISFRKISSNEPVIAHLCININRHLAKGDKVLWLVTGGSSVPLEVEVAQKLNKSNLRNLTVTLSDERYGPVGHPGSNWQQLLDAGFKLDGATLQPVLQGMNFEQTEAMFSKMLENNFSKADYKVGFIGIGPDGHAAGIKPHSPAISSNKMVAGYTSEDFVRLTITPKAIAKLDEAVSYALGEAKWPMLKQLAKNLPVLEQPAQALKAAGKLTVYNDYRGEEV